MPPFLDVPAASHYWLCNGRIPRSLLAKSALEIPWIAQTTPSHQPNETLLAVDIEIKAGQIVALQPAITSDFSITQPSEKPTERENIPAVDLRNGLIWPCFVDMHTHLDKGHIWPRQPNPTGTFATAITAVQQDSALWQAEDVYRRMEFGLKCSYAHGTQAIRTHLDAFGEQGAVSFEVFRALRAAWADKIQLQAACLVTLDYFMGPAGEALADLVAESGGILGGVVYMHPEIDQQLDRVFALAQARGLDLDFHTDESLEPEAIALRHVAQAAVRHQFTGKITCGHCCSLSVQSEAVRQETINWVKQAGIAVVSLPMCNLYLQDRQPYRQTDGSTNGQQHKTPRYRGVTVLHELKAAGVPVALASDNCRDPFFAYGDHDGLEVFTQSVRIGHLDHPISDWPRAVNRVPAQMMGLPNIGQIGPGLAAELVVFKARSLNELMARQQSDRAIIRAGKAIDTALPDYAELDDLMV
jgi:cytosine/creatinine deaminase